MCYSARLVERSDTLRWTAAVWSSMINTGSTSIVTTRDITNKVDPGFIAEDGEAAGLTRCICRTPTRQTNVEHCKSCLERKQQQRYEGEPQLSLLCLAAPVQLRAASADLGRNTIRAYSSV